MPQPPMITSPHSPDVEQVRTWLQKMIAQMRFMELVIAVVALVTRLRDLNTELTKQLANLRRKRPKSETLERLERQLTLPFVADKRASSPPKDKERESTKPKNGRPGNHPGRTKPPPHLERIPVNNPVPPERRICPVCGSEMTTVGHSICELLNVIPARLVVTQRLDETVACPNDDTIVKAEPPAQIVERGKLGDELIVEAMCDKYLNHQPIERQCTDFERYGVNLAPQTLGRSVAKCIDLLVPIGKLIVEQTRGPGMLGTDCTGLPVLDPAVPEGIRNGAIWCWTNARWVTFFYSASGDSDSVRRFLGDDLQRTVQCDGTSVLSFVERAGGKRPGCWAHGRRGLVEAAKAGDSLALEGLRKLAPLFKIEKDSKLAGDTAAERLARRREHSQPIVDEVRAWLDEQRDLIPPKTPLGRALGYLHRQWKRLTLFLDDGNVELTNNRRERELRRLVLGRRNWLFVWDDLGAERAAIVLTIFATCIAHEINPRAYAHVVTKLIVNGWPQSRLRDLLPDRILATHPELHASPESRNVLDASAQAARLPAPAQQL